MKVYGITTIRNEADLIAANLLYHLSLGLDRILVIDNGSSDQTPAILRQLAADYAIHWSIDDGPYRQAELMTRLARAAVAEGADWIVPFDADEFWYAPSGDLRQVLAASSADALHAQVLHYIQARDQLEPSPDALLTMTRRAPRMIGPLNECRRLVEAGEIAYVESRYAPKRILRARGDVCITTGNHAVAGCSRFDATPDLVCLHAAVRSLKTLRDKVAHAERVKDAEWLPHEGWHVRRLQRLEQHGSLEAEWAANSYADDTLDLYGTERPVIIDTKLRDVVAPFLKSDRSPGKMPARSKTAAPDERWVRRVTQEFLTNLHEDALAQTQRVATIESELMRARVVVADLQEELERRTAWAERANRDHAGAIQELTRVQTEFTERTEWAHRVAKERDDARALVPELQRELQERTKWAQKVADERDAARAVIPILEKEIDERTQWAHTCNRDLEEARERIAALAKLVDDRAAWAKQRDADVLKAQSVIEELHATVQERNTWAQNADREAAQARADLARLQQEFAERSAWAQSLIAERDRACTVVAQLQAELRAVTPQV